MNASATVAVRKQMGSSSQTSPLVGHGVRIEVEQSNEVFADSSELLMRYLTLHDLRYRVGDIKLLSDEENQRLGEKAEVYAEQIVERAEALVKLMPKP